MKFAVTVVNETDHVIGTTYFEKKDQASKFFFDGIDYDLRNGREVDIVSRPFCFISYSENPISGDFIKRIFEF